MKRSRSMWLILAILLVLGIVPLAYLRHPQFGKPPESKHFESPQYREGAFRNENDATVEFGFLQGLKIFPKVMSREGDKIPTLKLPIRKFQPATAHSTDSSQVRVTWLGHSAVLLEWQGMRVALDPMLGPSCSPMPFTGKRFQTEIPLQAGEMPPLDAVILTHDHYDHLDYTTILAIKDRTARFIVPLGVGAHLIHWGVAPEKITELDWWSDTELGGMRLVCTPAQHFSGRGPRDRGATLWCSWVIQAGPNRLFFSGDSGYFKGFETIGQAYGPFDLCMVECGQYNELWRPIHMFPEESVQACIDLKGRLYLPLHWGAFSLAMHPWHESPERAWAECKRRGLAMATPLMGETFVPGQQVASTPWWRDFQSTPATQ